MYYLMYKPERFSKDILEQTKQLGLEPNIQDIKRYLKFITKHYNIKKDIPTITIESSNSLFGRGCYIKSTNEIIFYGKLDLLTVLHEIRHYIQFHSIISPILSTYDEREDDARGWSSSLFYTIYPTEYLKLANQGKIKFI